jgi:prepilin-type N-terminal cleavage/methylation domain-containing protein
MTARRIAARAAFTLIEVVVVLLVLSAVAVVTVPAFLDAPHADELTLATRRIEALFRLARDSAARGGQPVKVVIDSATSRVWFDVPGELAPEADAPRRIAASPGSSPAALAGEDLELPRSVHLRLSAARATFRFAPSGAAFADSLRLVAPQGTRLITIHPWTGDVLVH